MHAATISLAAEAFPRREAIKLSGCLRKVQLIIPGSPLQSVQSADAKTATHATMTGASAYAHLGQVLQEGK